MLLVRLHPCGRDRAQNSYRRGGTLGFGWLLVALVGSAAFPPSAQAVFPRRTQQKPAVSAALQELDQLKKAGLEVYGKGDFKTAGTVYHQGLKKAQVLADKEYTAWFLSALGRVYNALGQRDKALDYLSKSLAIREKIGNQRDIADSLRNLGDVYDDLGQYDKALDYHSRALAIREKIGNQQDIASSLEDLGGVYSDLVQDHKALACERRALAIREKIGNQQDIANSLRNLGNAYYNLGQYDKALDCHKRDVTMWEKLGNARGIAFSLMSLGNLYISLGQYTKAPDSYIQALALFEKLGNQKDIVYSLNNLGAVYACLGQYDKALDYQNRALAIHEKIGNQQDIATSLTNLGAVYDDLGQYDKALDYQNRVSAIYEKLGNAAEVSVGLTGLGIAYYRLGQNDKALDYFSHALSIREKLGNQRDIAGSLGPLGNVYWSLGRFDKALDCHKRALAVFEKIGNEPAIGGSLWHLGDVYHSLGQNDKALDYYYRSLAIQEKLGNQMGIAGSFNNLGNVYTSLSQFDKAEDAYARALRAFEDVSLQVGDPADLGSFQDTLPTFYGRYAHLLLMEHKPERALEMAERGRAQGLARQLYLNRHHYTKDFTPQDAQLLQVRTADLTAANRLRRNLQNKRAGASTQQQAALQQQLQEADTRQKEAERQFTLLRDSLFAHYPQFRNVVGEEPPTIDDLKALARRHPDTLYLEWVIVDDKTTLLFALSQAQGLQAFTLSAPDKSLLQLASDWRTSIAASGGRGTHLVTDQTVLQDAQEQQRAQALYTALLGEADKAGLLASGKFTHLVLVGEGPMLDIPFAALMDSQGKRLVERYALSSAISLGLFFWRDNPNAPTASLLCVADPMGAEDKPREIVSRGGTFGPLPAAREEGKAVAALFSQSLLLVGPQAREGAIKQVMDRYAILHFATHGSLDDTNGLRSGLILAPEPEQAGGQTGGEDGVLEGRELINRSLSAQLAVLSACETSRGQARGGDGLQSLAWTFRAGGCPCVVASQWQVDDAATRELMVDFYEALKAGKDKDVALQEAMLAVSKKQPGVYYWAAFQVIGDTTPLNLTK